MDLTGPPLRGIERRWNNYWYLKQWIRNWNVAVANGWPVAIRAQNEKPTAMSIFEHLTDQQLDQVIAYITNESLKPGPPTRFTLCRYYLPANTKTTTNFSRYRPTSYYSLNRYFHN